MRFLGFTLGLVTLLLAGWWTSVGAQTTVLWRPLPTPYDQYAWRDGQWDNSITGDNFQSAPIHAVLCNSGNRGRLIMWNHEDEPPEISDFQLIDLDPTDWPFDPLDPATPHIWRFDHPVFDHHPLCAGQAFFQHGDVESLLIVGGEREWRGQSEAFPGCVYEQGACMGSLSGDNQRCAPADSNASIWDFLALSAAGLSTRDVTCDAGQIRYYPTCLTMPDGKVQVFGGDYWDDSGIDPQHPHVYDGCEWPGEWSKYDYWLEFDPASGWSRKQPGTEVPPVLHNNYPHCFVVDGPGSPWEQGIFWTGEDHDPEGGIAYSRLYDLNYNLQFQTVRTTTNREHSSAVLFTKPGSAYRNSAILLLGGDNHGPPLGLEAYNTAQVFDLANPDAWTDTPQPMNNARADLNAVLLPNGKTLVVGGKYWQATSSCPGAVQDPAFQEYQCPVYAAEMYDAADTPCFTRMAAMSQARVYHSIALLLPDGRVLSAGTNDPGHGWPEDPSYAIYYPPYLFKQQAGISVLANRPAITSYPGGPVEYGDVFSIGTNRALGSHNFIEKVVLMGLGSVTHSVDMGQRRDSLSFTVSGSSGLCVTAPANGYEAPPGSYMLFLLDSLGVPSVSKFIRLKPTDRAPATCSTGGSEGCPYLYAWNGGDFVMDNNLMPASEFLGEPTGYFTDHYKLMQPLVAGVDGYRLEIREAEEDHDYFDGVQLRRIDRHPDLHVAVTPDGRLVKYVNEIHATNVVDSDGDDLTDPMAIRDGVKIRLFEGGTMTLAFSGVHDYLQTLISSGQPIDLLLVVDEKAPHCQAPCPEGGGSIIVQVPDPGGGPDAWTDVVIAHPRALWEDYVVSLSGVITQAIDTLRVRLVWTETHSIDMAALLQPSTLPAQVQLLPLQGATHSVSGSVLNELLHADSVFAEMRPGESISVRFGLGPTPYPGSVQEFVFSSKGYYVDDSGGTQGARPLSPGWASPAGDRDADGIQPNPMPQGSGARITFSVASTGRASLAVYDAGGRRVRALYDEILSAGRHPIWWDGRDDAGRSVAPGIYFTTFLSDAGRETRKVVVIQ